MSTETIKTYQGGGIGVSQCLVTLENFVGDVENVETIDDGTFDCSDAVTAINALIWEMEKREAEIERLRAALTEAREEICWWASEHGCCLGHEDHALTMIDAVLTPADQQLISEKAK